MTSEGTLFGGIYARGAVAAEVSDRAWLQAMLDVEAALARACAAEGLIPEAAAEEIARACRAEAFDVDALGRAAADSATPVVGLVKALRAAVPEPVREHVHLGATSQDVADTALMLIARRALEPLLQDAAAAADAAARLADEHRATPMIGRTLLQQALPITFGLRAAGWLVGIDAAADAPARGPCRELAVQMGGPVGARAPAVAAHVAVALGLAEPVMPWQAIRVRPVALAAALGAFCGVLAKIARDVTLLAQQEVAEVREGGDADRGGSSAMAHKRNPVGAVSVLACAKRTPGPRGHRAGGDGAGARAGRGSVAGGVGDPHRAPDAHRLGGGVGARAAREPDGGCRADARQPRRRGHRRRPHPGRRRRADRPRAGGPSSGDPGGPQLRHQRA